MSGRRAWVERLFRSIDAKDAETFLGFLHDEVLFRFGNAAPTQGKSAAGAAVQGFFQSIRGVRHTLIDTWDLGDTVICRGDVTYSRHDTSILCVPFVNVLQLDGGLIREYLIYVDISALYREG